MEAKKEVVGFLGPKASYTHQATLGHFPGPQYDVRPLTTIEDVFAAVQSGQAAYGVVPFENSSNGSVVFTLDLFADLHGRKIPQEQKEKMQESQTPPFPVSPLNNHQVYPAK
ncbi:hypothetical protein KC324_g18786 [Hortaea werneckii]|nr:hypothetical protein KC324_g18786 [Hortaea werneckii]